MIKLLIGGSPCTYWSIAQTKNREVVAEGMGWELFLNYRIARDKYKPDYFLYENNKSMSPAIRAQITAELGVEPVLINSALVSAQNRQRLYWVGRRNPDGTYSKVDVEQPVNRGILLRDILESGVVWREKGYALLSTTGGSTAEDMIARKQRNGVAEPVKIKPLAATGHQSRLVIEAADGKQMPVYEVRGGRITIKGKTYPIKLADGFYIIRKLTVTECKRLQTVPDTYVFPVSDTQAYKMLGNGWTVDVIAHIMSHFDGLTEEPVAVLSMYDGMACGRIALEKLGANVSKYWATEIDKYAIKTTLHNFPNVVQLGDAFDIRMKNAPWCE